MVEFGNDFIIESYRIPWLIWIQLTVMILLVILLYFGFAVFDLDPSAVSSTAAVAPPHQLDKPCSSNNPRRTKKENRKVKMGAGTSGVSNIEDEREDVESSMKESAFLKIFKSPNHPCNFFGHCKHAFLKCLGLDSSTESSTDPSHDKQE